VLFMCRASTVPDGAAPRSLGISVDHRAPTYCVLGRVFESGVSPVAALRTPVSYAFGPYNSSEAASWREIRPMKDASCGDVICSNRQYDALRIVTINYACVRTAPRR
jgi:hypothetical protein